MEDFNMGVLTAAIFMGAMSLVSSPLQTEEVIIPFVLYFALVIIIKLVPVPHD